MSTKSAACPDSAKIVPITAKTTNISELLQPYGFGDVPFVRLQLAPVNFQVTEPLANTTAISGR
jgi:hypothetical protein